MEKLNQLVELANKAHEEGLKFNKGNKSAGTRVRKNALEISKLCKEIRKEVSEKKNAE